MKKEKKIQVQMAIPNPESKYYTTNMTTQQTMM